MRRHLRILTWSSISLLVLILTPRFVMAQNRVYLMNDNHTDYGWNDTVANYESAMLSELDYYLNRVALTGSNPADEQARYAADGWYWLWLYKANRSPAQFQNLVSRIQSGHVEVPLNPMVTLYGALQTEAAIRSGYWPGKLQRQYGLPFRMAQDIENATSPWGLTSVWAGSGVEFTWKGICGCATAGTYTSRDTEVFRWQGPDDKTLLMKWYYLGGNASWGGYAEARDNLSQAGVQSSINHFSTRAPFVPVTGLFGGGWDDVSWQTTQFETLAQQWNAAHPGGDRLRVSNGVDYFDDLAAYAASLPLRRGGWGNEWDMGPAALGERTAQTRRAIESLHAAEGLAAIVHKYDTSIWPPQQTAVEAALVDFHKYYEHTWGVAGGVPLSSVVANKKLWAQHFDDAVAGLKDAAATRFATLFTTPNTEDRFVVFNPLAFARTDYSDLPVSGAGPYIVTDVASNTEVPNQVVNLGGSLYLRILASNVPSFGYRVYRYQSGSGANFGNAATVASNVIESSRYRVTLGTRGELSSVIDKSVLPNVELAGAAGLNDFGSGASAGLSVENAGPVSVTLRRDISGTPSRRVRVTLLRDADRIEIEDEILANYTPLAQYSFQVNLSSPQIRFEEVGAVMRPGFTPSGDFLLGARTDYVTLNHFASFASSSGGPYTITLSNADAFLMRIGNSTTTAFDLPTATVRVVASAGTPFQNAGWYGSDIYNQGGDAYVLDRFAVQGSATAYSGAAALRVSLAHQNPLEALALVRNQSGPLSDPTQSFLSVSAANAVVTAVKPAEESNRGWIVRLWETDGSATNFTIDASAFAPTTASATTLIETDSGATSVNGGVIAASIAANELKTYRFGGAPPPPTATASNTPAASATATRTGSSTPTRTRTPTPTASNTPIGPTYTATRTATSTITATASPTAPSAGQPLAAFCLDEGSGVSATDASGNGHTGSLVSSPTWVAGRAGQALRFDGNRAGHQYVTFGPDDAFDALSAGTIMAWVKPAASGATKCFFQSGQNGACQWPLELCVNGNGQFEFWGGAAPCAATLNATAPIPAPITDWHHLAYVVDATGNKFYVDGQLVTPTYIAGASTTKLFFAQTATGASKYRFGSTESAGETFDGVVDELRVYGAALNQAQIQSAMTTAFCAPATATPTGSPTATITATATSTPSFTATATWSSTPTRTATAVASPTASFVAAISGVVRYFTNATPVPDVDVRVQGVVPQDVLSAADGAFSALVVGPDNWRIEPAKTSGGENSITAADGSCILQGAVGSRELTPMQRLAADTNGSGTLTAFDTSLVLQYRVGLIPRLPVAARCDSDWLFVPLPGPARNQLLVNPVTASVCTMGAITYQPLVGAESQQDFAAILIGDCLGNWRPPGGGGGSAASTAPRLTWAERHAARGLRVPIAVTAEVASGGLDLDIDYDPSALRFRGVRRLGAGRGAVIAVNARQPGLVRVAMAASGPIEPGVVLVALFDPDGAKAGRGVRVRARP